MRRSEKMALRNNGTLLVTALLLIAAISRGQAENVYQLSGSDVTLSPIYRGDFKEITWLLNNNKLVDLELNDMKQPVWYKTFPQLKAGASLNNQTGELTIPRLTISDSGNYRAEVKLHDLTYHYTDITLTVKDPVVTPNITEPLSETIEPTNLVVTPIITNQTTEDWIYLSCESATSGVSYKWQDDKGEIVSKDKTYIFPKPIKLLTLTCIASNALSERRASVTIVPPGRLSDWAIVGITVGIIAGILVLIVVIIWIFECIRRKCCNHPLVKAISKRCPPFPYIPCLIRALRVNLFPWYFRNLLTHITECPNNPCCLREFVKNKEGSLGNPEDLQRHIANCTRTHCCMKDEVIAWNNLARPNMAEDKLKPENEGNGTPEQQEILLENRGKGSKTGSREEV